MKPSGSIVYDLAIVCDRVAQKLTNARNLHPQIRQLRFVEGQLRLHGLNSRIAAQPAPSKQQCFVGLARLTQSAIGPTEAPKWMFISGRSLPERPGTGIRT